jgi:hypothetical protein
MFPYPINSNQQLKISAKSIISGFVRTRGLIRLKNGGLTRIDDSSLNITSASLEASATQTLFKNLPDGELLSLNIRPVVSRERGLFYVKAEIVDQDGIDLVTLCSDYAGIYNPCSFPYGGVHSSFEGRGYHGKQTGANPAAQTNYSFTFSNLYAKILSVEFLLTTDGTAGNRRAFVAMENSAGAYGFFSYSESAQAASTATRYIFSPGLHDEIVNTLRQCTLASDFEMPVGGKLIVGAENMQAGDQISSIVFAYECWIAK